MALIVDNTHPVQIVMVSYETQQAQGQGTHRLPTNNLRREGRRNIHILCILFALLQTDLQNAPGSNHDLGALIVVHPDGTIFPHPDLNAPPPDLRSML